MTTDEILQNIHDFLDLIENGKGSVEENEKYLSLALDRIALSIHFIEYTKSDAEVDYPKYDSQELTKHIGKMFPNYGYYNIPNLVSREIPNSDMLVGDAIDDILDIYQDLKTTAIFWQQYGKDEALDYFDQLYLIHWGEHLRNLQWYIFHQEKEDYLNSISS